ncbi:MAG: SDR family NAD(P)-dependent oxidoreductase [Acidimicrobiales bacterium]
MSGQPLLGRTAVVTGAGQGVGRGIALALAGRGANVVVAARRAETGEPVAEEIRARGGVALCLETDVTRRSDVEAVVASTVDRFGALQVMVHNAFRGGGRHRLEDVDAAAWEPYSRTAVWASFLCAQAAFPHLRAAGSLGRLILVTSPAGVEGSANLPVYAPVKAAQRAMAKSLAREWGRHGITVNCVAPVAETPSLTRALEADPALRQRLVGRTPLGRLGDAEADVGAVTAFLAGDDAGYVTGQTIVCDGGSFTGL